MQVSVDSSIVKIRRYLRNRIVHTANGFRLWSIVRPSSVHLTRTTDLVVEGFPRSGNSFAEAAILCSQAPKLIRIAHHSHSAGQVLLALQRSLPILLLFREPIDAVTSLIERSDGDLTAEIGLDEYVRFYTPLINHQERILFASFDEVTLAFNQVISKLNTMYKLELRPLGQYPEVNNHIFTKIDEISIKRTNKITRYSRLAGYAHNNHRTSILDKIRQDIQNNNNLRERRKKADLIHRRMVKINADQSQATE